ncbi:hypothetical protein N2152v2_000286 [Parachlorella kessleri]
MSASCFSSFAIQLEGYDSDEVLSPPRPARQAMKLKRRNQTLTSPKASAAKPHAGHQVKPNRQNTPAPEAENHTQQPCSSQRVTRAGAQQAAARGSTPSLDTVAATAAAGSGRKHGRPATKAATPSLDTVAATAAAGSGRKRGRVGAVAEASREPTPAVCQDQENQSLNLRRSSRARSASQQAIDSSTQPPSKKLRGVSKSPAPPTAVRAAEAVQQQGATLGGDAPTVQKAARRGRSASKGPASPGQPSKEGPRLSQGQQSSACRNAAGKCKPAAEQQQQQEEEQAHPRPAPSTQAQAFTIGMGPFTSASIPRQVGAAQPAVSTATQQPARSGGGALLAGRPSVTSLSLAATASRGGGPQRSERPQRSESVLDSIIKSPSPPLRSDSVRTRPLSLAMQLNAAAGAAQEPVGLPQIAAFRGEQPAVDQPPPGQHAQQAQPLPQAAVVAPEPPQQQHQLAAAPSAPLAAVLRRAVEQQLPRPEQEPVEEEGRGESPQLEAGAAAADQGQQPPLQQQHRDQQVEGASPMSTSHSLQQFRQQGPGEGEQPEAEEAELPAPKPDLREARLSISPVFHVPPRPAALPVASAACAAADYAAVPDAGAAASPVAAAPPAAEIARLAGTAQAHPAQQPLQGRQQPERQQQGEEGVPARRQSPRLKQASTSGSGEQPAVSVRRAADVAGAAPTGTLAQREQQQEGRQGSPQTRSSPQTPRSRQPSAGTAAERSTAHKGAPAAGNACTPVSRAEPPAGAAEGDASWFDPLDPDKVSQAKSVLALGACASGIPLCRDREVRLIDGILQKHLREGTGTSLYVSGLPGTGKSLTVQQLVRECHRPLHAASSHSAAETAAAGTAAGASKAASPAAEPASQPAQLLLPALISINCMTLSDPQRVAGAIVGCYHAAAAAAAYSQSHTGSDDSGSGEHGAAAVDPLVRPAAEHVVPSNADAFRELQKLVLAPPVAAPDEGPATRRGAGRGTKGAGAITGRRQRANKAAAKDGGRKDATGGLRGMLVVVLDEIDGLLASHASGTRAGKAKAPRAAAAFSPLLDLLVLAHHPRSRLVLVGIANDLNLVHKIMPDVMAHPAAPQGMKPHHVPFTPYQSYQVSRLLQQRLAALPGPCFDPRAVEMCARKMGNGNGDMRLALQACTQALTQLVKDAHEAAAKAQPAQQQPERDEGTAKGAGTGTAAAAGAAAAPGPRRVGLRQMGAALGGLTGGIGISNHYVQMVRALPPQQQLIMCAVAKLLGDTLAGKGTPLPKAARSLLSAPPSSSKKTVCRAQAAQFMSPQSSISISRGGSGSFATSGGAAGTSGSGGAPALAPAAAGRSRDISMGQLYEVFTLLCQQIGYRDRWDPSLFYAACDNMDSLLAISRNSNPSLRRVTMKCHEDDVVMGVADTPQVRTVDLLVVAASKALSFFLKYDEFPELSDAYRKWNTKKDKRYKDMPDMANLRL